MNAQRKGSEAGWNHGRQGGWRFKLDCSKLKFSVSFRDCRQPAACCLCSRPIITSKLPVVSHEVEAECLGDPLEPPCSSTALGSGAQGLLGGQFWNITVFSLALSADDSALRPRRWLWLPPGGHHEACSPGPVGKAGAGRLFSGT